MTLLELDVNELEEMRCHLANYFCEDERNFRLEECAKIFDDFLAKFQKAVADNRIRQLQERKAEQRRRSRDIVNKDIAQTTNDGRYVLLALCTHKLERAFLDLYICLGDRKC